jgi:hypothetical protein
MLLVPVGRGVGSADGKTEAFTFVLRKSLRFLEPINQERPDMKMVCFQVMVNIEKIKNLCEGKNN